jgi:hypothetical protein
MYFSAKTAILSQMSRPPRPWLHGRRNGHLLRFFIKHPFSKIRHIICLIFKYVAELSSCIKACVSIHSAVRVFTGEADVIDTQSPCGFCGKKNTHSWLSAWHPARHSMVLLCSIFFCVVVQGLDEVQYKPKNYQASKTLKTNTYQPKTQPNTKPFESKAQPTPARQLTEKQAPEGKKVTSAPATSTASLESIPPFEGKAPSQEKLVDNKPYVPGETDNPSTITANPGGAGQEKKLFIVATNQSYIATERPKVRDPMLEPRQGIKAPEETLDEKDARK